MGFSFDYLLQGFATALTLQNLFWAPGGLAEVWIAKQGAAAPEQ